MNEHTVRPEIRQFFEQYTQANDHLDADAIGASFADTFLSLDPNTAAAVSREQLLAVLPRRQQMFSQIGGDGADLSEIAETPLDEQHTLVHTTWQLRFDDDHKDAQPFTLESTFLLRRRAARWQIVVYLNHYDIAARVARRAD